MTATTYLQLTLLDVGQREKETTINANMTALDAKSLRFLGNAAADPSATGVPAGSTYYNTAIGKLKVLIPGGQWWVDTSNPRYLGDLAADPATTGVPAGSTYYNTVTSKLKVLRANATWAAAA